MLETKFILLSCFFSLQYDSKNCVLNHIWQKEKITESPLIQNQT